MESYNKSPLVKEIIEIAYFPISIVLSQYIRFSLTSETTSPRFSGQPSNWLFLNVAFIDNQV